MKMAIDLRLIKTKSRGQDKKFTNNTREGVNDCRKRIDSKHLHLDKGGKFDLRIWHLKMV